MLVSKLFISAISLRIAAIHAAGLVVNLVKHLPQAIGIHEYAAAVKRRETRRPIRGKEGDLLEQAVDGTPNQLAHGTVLLPRHGPQPLHHQIRKQNLNLLHGYML
jgi:hypothetical protein